MSLILLTSIRYQNTCIKDELSSLKSDFPELNSVLFGYQNFLIWSMELHNVLMKLKQDYESLLISIWSVLKLITVHASFMDSFDNNMGIFVFSTDSTNCTRYCGRNKQAYHIWQKKPEVHLSHIE